MMLLQQKIRPMWTSILSTSQISAELKAQLEDGLDRLSESFYVGLNQIYVDKLEILSDELRHKWTKLVYREINGRTNGLLKDYIELLDQTNVDIPHKRQTLKNFIYFKRLIELVPDIENKLNDRLELLKNGNLP